MKRVSLHEPLTGLRRIVVVTLAKGMPRHRGLARPHGAAWFRSDTGKICVAVNEDIDPENADALLWAIAYRANPLKDMQDHRPARGLGHGPAREDGKATRIRAC